MNNKISNQTFSSPKYASTSINGAVTISETAGGHYDELDDTLGAERRVRLHPNGTREIWTNDQRELTVYGDNFKIIVGNDTVSVTGTVNLVVNGDCNTTVGGNYNLTVLKDMNVSVKGSITHKCDGAHVTETSSGDIINISGSQLQNHSIGDMITRCGGAYDCRVTSDFNVNAQTTSFLGLNFVCGAAGVISLASGISTSLSGTVVNVAGTASVNLQSAFLISNTSPLVTAGPIPGLAINLFTHMHPTAPTGPITPPIPGI